MKTIHLRVYKNDKSELIKITHKSIGWNGLMNSLPSMGYSKVEVVGAVKTVEGIDKQKVTMEKAPSHIIEEVLIAHTGSNVVVKTKDEQISDLKKQLEEAKRK